MARKLLNNSSGTGLAAARRVLGTLLVVTEPESVHTKRHLADLAKASAALHERLKVAGLAGVFVGAVAYPELDANQHLRGERPRGYSDGVTWDDLAAGYDPGRRMVAVGHARPYGSTSAMLHEYGHAAGHLLGYNDDARLIAAHRRLYPRLLAYFQQGGPGGFPGRRELMAEGFAVYVNAGRAKCVQLFDEGFASLLDDIMKQGGH